MSLRALVSAAAMATVADAQLGDAAQCIATSATVNSECCVGGDCSGSIPSTCLSTTCAAAFLPYYRECGLVLQAIEMTIPNSGSFSSLYSSCVDMQGSTNAATGKIVDTGVIGSTLYDFTTVTSVDDWRVTVDGVMGGHSSGTFSMGTDGTCTGAVLAGVIELTHGGFVNVDSPDINAGDLAHADGLRVCSKSNVDYGASDGVGDYYKVLLSDGSYTSWQADFHTAEAGAADINADDNCDGVISTLPFAQFWPTHYGQVTGAQGSIDPANIDGTGFDVSFLLENGDSNSELDHQACADGLDTCVNENPFALCVQWIQYYSNVDKAGN